MGRQSVKGMSRRQQKAVFAKLGSSGSDERTTKGQRAEILKREFGKKELAKALNVPRNIFILNTPDEVHDAVFDYTVSRNLRIKNEAELKKEKRLASPDSFKVNTFSRHIKHWKRKEKENLSLLKKKSKKHKLDYCQVINVFE